MNAAVIVPLAVFGLLAFTPIPFDAGLPPVKPIRSHQSSNAAIVLIHGWNGDATTWKAFPALFDNDASFRDLDVLLVHYPSYMLRRNGTIPALADWISWHIDNVLPDKDIYIIAHSMGGVISRKLFLQRKLAQNSDRIKLILTIASPHNGANFARLADAIGVSKGLTQDLVQGSSLLEDIKIGWRDFRRKRRPAEARSVCLGSPHDIVVPADSAVDQCDDFLQYPQWGHSEMIIPASATDARYSTPAGMLRKALTTAAPAPTKG